MEVGRSGRLMRVRLLFNGAQLHLHPPLRRFRVKASLGPEEEIGDEGSEGGPEGLEGDEGETDEGAGEEQSRRSESRVVYLVEATDRGHLSIKRNR